jgi:hypothetical protein
VKFQKPFEHKWNVPLLFKVNPFVTLQKPYRQRSLFCIGIVWLKNTYCRSPVVIAPSVTGDLVGKPQVARCLE